MISTNLKHHPQSLQSPTAVPLADAPAQDSKTKAQRKRNKMRPGAALCACFVIFLIAGCTASETATTPPTPPISSEENSSVTSDTASEATPGAAPEASPTTTEQAEEPQEKPLLIATTSIWADIFRNITCDGQLAQVESLIPRGADPHGFEPSLADRGQLGRAALVAANGLGLESGLASTLSSTADDGTPVLYVGDLFSEVFDLLSDAEDSPDTDHEDEHEDEDHEHEDEHADMDEHDDHEHEDEHADMDEHDDHEDHDDEDEHDHEDGDRDDEDHEHEHEDEDAGDHEDHDDEDEHDDEDHEHEHEDEHEDEDEHEHEDEHDDMDDHADEHEHDEHAGHDHGPIDPHIWLDPLLVANGLEHISEALVLQAGLDRDSLAACIDAYETSLTDLHEDLLEVLEQVPPEHRKLITNHDAFGYFANRYDFEILGYVLPSNPLAEASAAKLPELANLLDETSLPAVFDEYLSVPSDTLKNLVEGRRVKIAALYTGSLGEQGGEADTYLGMLRTNAAVIASALGNGS